MTDPLDQHCSTARREGVAAFVAAIRADPAMLEAVRNRVAAYNAVVGARGEAACWITKKNRETLLAVLAAANAEPGVPAGDVHV